MKNVIQVSDGSVHLACLQYGKHKLEMAMKVFGAARNKLCGKLLLSLLWFIKMMSCDMRFCYLIGAFESRVCLSLREHQTLFLHMRRLVARQHEFW